MAKEINFKGLLLNLCVKQKKSQPEFPCSGDGPPHNPRFTCQVLIDGIVLGEGEGKSKKDAEHKASKAALLALGYRKAGIQPDFDALLNELCQKKGWTFSFVAADRTGPSHNAEFTCKATVDGNTYPESSKKKTKKLAKKEAAYIALRELRRAFPDDPVIPEMPDVFIDETGSENCSYSGSNGEISIDRSTGENGPVESAAASSRVSNNHNYISIINEICQKKNWICNFYDKRIGENPHNLQFVCDLSIKEKTDLKKYPESNPRKTKQLAKREAAFLALKELKSKYRAEIPDLPEVYVDESMHESLSVSSPGNFGQNKTTSESGLASSDQISFRDSAPTNPSAQRLANGLQHLPLANIEGSSSSSCSNFSMSPMCNPLRDFDDITTIDSGTFGKVMKAKKRLDDMYYAVKRVPIKNRSIKKYLEEVKVLARFDHPNIMRFYHAWLENDFVVVKLSESSESGSSSSSRGGTRIEMECLFIQMELCEKGSLKKWIEQRNLEPKIDKTKSLRFFRQIIDAVKYIHSQKLIHRDLKPANILFTRGMVVKIGDFGLVAQMTGEDESQARQRTQGTGTQSYMAPEQRDGNIYENEVDIYALGLILVELLWIFRTGHERVNEWLNIRKGCLPSTFEEQHPVEGSEIKKMLSEDPKKRPTAEQLKEFFAAHKMLENPKTSFF